MKLSKKQRAANQIVQIINQLTSQASELNELFTKGTVRGQAVGLSPDEIKGAADEEQMTALQGFIDTFADKEEKK
jgi:hypothetical protein